jgi:mannose-6-phosphate isomerase
MSLQKLSPYLSHTVWGGAKLNTLKNIRTAKSDPVGETWEISSIKSFSSLLSDVNLSELVELKYLVKFIDTAKNLSIQVHPDDQYAKEHEASSGKNESWLILDHAPDACIYLGFKPGVTKREFKLALENGLNIDRFLNKIKVSKGDFFSIPAGSIHAIGEGITLLEVQQSSGLTYRVWDWNRKGLDGRPRELHIEKAFDVLNFSEKHNLKLKTPLKKNIGVESELYTFKEFQDFEVSFLTFNESKTIDLGFIPKEGFIVLDGELTSNEEVFKSYESYICLDKVMYKFYAKKKTTVCLIKEKL